MVPQLTLGRSARMRRERIVDFRSRDVVITGGTGALGAAVVETLLEAGAICHVPYIVAREAELFPHRGHPNVKLSADIDLTQEDIVGRFYDSVPSIWASIHLAGGFAMAPLVDTKRSDLMRLVELNMMTTYLCCRSAVSAMRRGWQGGRIVNVAARPALEWRRWNDRIYGHQGGGRRVDGRTG